MRWLLGIVLAFVVLAILGGAALWVWTRGDYAVMATVTDDTDLPAIEVAGVRLHSQGFGPEDGPLVIVLHGGPGGDHRSLLPLSALGDDGWRVMFYDQRGAGLSQRVGDDLLTLQGHIDELSTIADRFSPDAPVTLIGHSWGAMLASAWLGRNPDRVARAVLIEPGFLSAAQSDAFMDRMSGMMRTPAMGWTALVTGFRASHVRGPDADASQDFLFGTMAHAFADAPDNPYHCPGMAYDSPAWRFGARPGQMVQAQASRADLDSLGQVGAFQGPVLLVTGACDTWIGASLQRENLARFLDARLVDIPGAGHDVIDDAPDAALDVIRDFLEAPT